MSALSHTLAGVMYNCFYFIYNYSIKNVFCILKTPFQLFVKILVWTRKIRYNFLKTISRAYQPNNIFKHGTHHFMVCKTKKLCLNPLTRHALTKCLDFLNQMLSLVREIICLMGISYMSRINLNSDDQFFLFSFYSALNWLSRDWLSVTFLLALMLTCLINHNVLHVIVKCSINYHVFN